MTRSSKNVTPLKAQAAKAGSPKPIQFNWRRHWSKKVAPYLNEPLVQGCLNFGMRLLNPDWKPGDAPCDQGAYGFNRIVKGKLSWYQALNRCHHIAYFSLAIGVLNYPDLDWRFVTGDVHTVPVGYGPDGQPRIAMDILLFDHFTAEESIAHTQKLVEKLKTSEEAQKNWEINFQTFIDEVVPKLKERARQIRKSRTPF